MVKKRWKQGCEEGCRRGRGGKGGKGVRGGVGRSVKGGGKEEEEWMGERGWEMKGNMLSLGKKVEVAIRLGEGGRSRGKK